MKTSNEKQLRDLKTPHPKTIEELTAVVGDLTDRPHDYGTCVYAMSIAAASAFNYVASKLGVTGFQASCADLDFLRRIRGLDGPFMIVKLEDALYPQCDLQEKVSELINKNRSWLKFEALKRIAERDLPHPDVFHRWVELAGFAPTDPDDIKQWNALSEDKIPNAGAAKWYDRNREQHDKNCNRLAFLRRWHKDQSLDFIDKHHAEMSAFGVTRVYLTGEPEISRAESCKEGGSIRLSLPVSLEFQCKVGAVEVSWSVDVEQDGSNGKPKLDIDFAKLGTMIGLAKPAVVKQIAAYMRKASK